MREDTKRLDEEELRKFYLSDLDSKKNTCIFIGIICSFSAIVLILKSISYNLNWILIFPALFLIIIIFTIKEYNKILEEIFFNREI